MATEAEYLAEMRMRDARERARVAVALEASRVTCPACNQRVDTKDWWALMVPRAPTIVTHLYRGIYCPGSRQNATRDADVRAIVAEGTRP